MSYQTILAFSTAVRCGLADRHDAEGPDDMAAHLFMGTPYVAAPAPGGGDGTGKLIDTGEKHDRRKREGPDRTLSGGL
jgi:hypothetical protein